MGKVNITDYQRVHYYTRGNLCWGWNYECYEANPDEGTATMLGWGYGLREGDGLVITFVKHGDILFEITFIKYFGNPPDMYSLGMKCIGIIDEESEVKDERTEERSCGNISRSG